MQQRRGDRAGRPAVPHREDGGTVRPDAGQPDGQQPGLAAGRRRSVQHAAAHLGGQRTPPAVGGSRSRRVAAVAAVVVVVAATVPSPPASGGHQPDRHRRAVVRAQGARPVAAVVPVPVLPAPAQERAGARPVWHHAQGAPVRAARLPEAQERGQADQGKCSRRLHGRTRYRPIAETFPAFLSVARIRD